MLREHFSVQQPDHEILTSMNQTEYYVTVKNEHNQNTITDRFNIFHIFVLKYFV